MSDQETTLLYALSTLAQTCAALAAFVGAVGIFRLQMLRDRRQDAERNLRDLSQQWMLAAALTEPMEEVLKSLGHMNGGSLPHIAPANQARSTWEAFGRRLRTSQKWLVVFEAWNLLLIGLGLVGFNYVTLLACWRGTFWALWAAAIGTVAVTGWCVFAWTRE